MTLHLEQADLLLDDLAEEEREQLLVIARLGEVLAEALLRHHVNTIHPRQSILTDGHAMTASTKQNSPAPAYA